MAGKRKSSAKKPAPTKCKATTRAGARCKKNAVPNGDRCLTHLGVVKKSTLTEEVADRLVEIVEEGQLVETAISLTGVPASTFWDWMKEKRAAPGQKPLTDRIAEARAKGERANVQTILKAAKGGDWRAAQYLLKLSNPDAFDPAAKVQATVEVPHGGATDQAGL